MTFNYDPWKQIYNVASLLLFVIFIPLLIWGHSQVEFGISKEPFWLCFLILLPLAYGITLFTWAIYYCSIIVTLHFCGAIYRGLIGMTTDERKHRARQWHSTFAWWVVRTEDDHWVWLTTVWRRAYSFELALGSGDVMSTYWEYRRKGWLVSHDNY